MSNFLDSGKRQSYGSGAVRDSAEGKPRYDLISPFFHELIWAKGGAFKERFVNYTRFEIAKDNSLLLQALEQTRKSPQFAESWGQFLACITYRAFYGERIDHPERALEYRLQLALVAGAKKYDERNWEKGIPTSRSFESLGRHVRSIIRESKDEDHYGAILCNVMFIWHNQRMVEEGRMDPKFADWKGYPKLRPVKVECFANPGSDSLHKDMYFEGMKLHYDPPLEDSKTFGSMSITPFAVKKIEACTNTFELRIRGLNIGTFDIRLNVYADRLAVAGCKSEVIKYILGGIMLPYKGDSLLYLAGPMRGHPGSNFPAFDKVRDRQIDVGYMVISPADIDRAAGFDPCAGVGTIPSTSEFVYRDTHTIQMLRPKNGDGLVMLDGWETSTGAAAEFHLALWLGLSIYNQDGLLMHGRKI